MSDLSFFVLSLLCSLDVVLTLFNSCFESTVSTASPEVHVLGIHPLLYELVSRVIMMALAQVREIHRFRGATIALLQLPRACV